MDNIIIVPLLAATLRMAAPLIFAGLGGVFSEKSGVVNIGLEGMMIMGAFFAVFGSYTTGSPIIGILFAMIAGGVIAAIHGFLSIHLRADQIISGTAINLFATALASFLIGPIFKTGGQTNIVKGLSYNLPGFLKNVPILNSLNWFVILAIVLVFVSNYVIFKTPLGLRIRAVGEHPSAADTLGISVYKMRYLCVIISGVLAGLGGAALSIGITPLYRDGMVAGRGFIALAAMIFGNWKPFGTMWACMLFAFGTAFQMVAQGFSISLPNEFYQSIPYILTMLALAGFVGKTEAPRADGKPYIKGER
ncbi:branched-chain amino acid transport system / permease component [Clostridium homopropionicum DSM 5847]|uniref:Branched-chain amino acid transport system / permease component n=1 Tax=Clostridium homopropionicum DSM 5847 TaxID=1121318 RepID=A0A0L6ZCP1_9CLOT|nr:ABC transporter permease [Clostridium homopropionicum]KOA20744.1 branched-chain amino acid transport system / permease component [Clostridium homopropionicum DSM 5847]SFF90122.1 nucleoside ABC transporter membrane protein [Clostridium homopropionicum]